jgi:hypothetical protein
VWAVGGVTKLPVTSHIPGVSPAALVAIAPVADRLSPAKAGGRTPTEERAKPIKTRALKKANREVEFVFMGYHLREGKSGKVIRLTGTRRQAQGFKFANRGQAKKRESHSNGASILEC